MSFNRQSRRAGLSDLKPGMSDLKPPHFLPPRVAHRGCPGWRRSKKLAPPIGLLSPNHSQTILKHKPFSSSNHSQSQTIFKPFSSHPPLLFSLCKARSFSLPGLPLLREREREGGCNRDSVLAIVYNLELMVNSFFFYSLT